MIHRLSKMIIMKACTYSMTTKSVSKEALVTKRLSISSTFTRETTRKIDIFILEWNTLCGRKAERTTQKQQTSTKIRHKIWPSKSSCKREFTAPTRMFLMTAKVINLMPLRSGRTLLKRYWIIFQQKAKHITPLLTRKRTNTKNRSKVRELRQLWA